MTILAVGSLALAGCDNVFEPASSDPALTAPEVLDLSQASSLGGGCAAVPSGLVSWWRAEGDAQDFTGTNNGTPMGTVAYAAGEVGQAFSLAGNGLVQVPDNATLDLTGQLSVEFWFEYQSASNFRGLVAKRATDAIGVTNYGVSFRTAAPGLGLYYNDPNVTGGDDYDFFNGNSTFEAMRSAAPSAGAWHHFAGTYRQLATSPDSIELLMYVDGGLVRADTLPGSLDNTVNSAPLTIGASLSLGSNMEMFSGLLDEVSVYSRALTPEEVEAIYQAGGEGKCTAPPADPMTPFASLEVRRARVERERGATRDRFDAWGQFTLGSSSDGISPATEEVQVTIGPVSQTIPAGSFERNDDDTGYEFHSNAPGIRQIQLRDDGVFRVWATQLDLSGLDKSAPMTFGLQIGNDVGAAALEFGGHHFRFAEKHLGQKEAHHR